MKLFTNKTKRYPTFFTVIEAIVNGDKSCVPFEINGIG